MPYKGGGAVMIDLVAGQVAFVFSPVPTAHGYVLEHGRLRALAKSGSEAQRRASPRCRPWPKPSRDSTSTPGSACSAPGACPAPVIDKINKAVSVALADPATAERLRTIGHEIKGGTPADMGRHLTREIDRWADLAKNVKIEVAE